MFSLTYKINLCHQFPFENQKDHEGLKHQYHPIMRQHSISVFFAVSPRNWSVSPINVSPQHCLLLFIFPFFISTPTYCGFIFLLPQTHSFSEEPLVFTVLCLMRKKLSLLFIVQVNFWSMNKNSLYTNSAQAPLSSFSNTFHLWALLFISTLSNFSIF